ncbi:MAG: OmpA family protein [Bacteroidia bacterium]
MKTVLVSCLFLFSCLGAAAQNFSLDTIYFTFDRFDLQSSDKIHLDSLIGDFTSYPSYFVQIYGHTDSIGSDQYNLELSRLRAREIALYLVDQGVDLKRIEYEGLGTTKPVGSNLTYSGRTMNRRADLAIVYADGLVLPGQADTSAANVADVPVEEPKDVPDTIYCDYTPFTINPAKQTVIIAPKGATFVISPTTLQTEAEQVSVEVNELYDRKTMVELAMPTLSKEGPLEAAGMISLNIRDGRKIVNISTENPIAVTMPATRRDADMAVYSGTGGARGGRSKRSRGANAQTPFQVVNGWNLEGGVPVKFLGREKAYSFDMLKNGRVAIARPLYHSQDTGPDDLGVDIEIKFKGKVFPRTTKAMIIGERVKTYIPMKRKDKRNYSAANVKFVDPARTELIIFAVQYDDRGNPWVAQRSFKVGEVASKKKSAKGRPLVKFKMKYRKVTKAELDELLSDL